MNLVKDFLVNQKTVLLTGEYAFDGRLCTRVVEGNKTFLVDLKPIKLLDGNLKFMCSSFTVAMNGARAILGKKMSMCPIILNYKLGICMFPIKSPFKDDNIWFNPDHIIKTTPYGSKTDVYLSNGLTIRINLTQSSFHNKIQKARQLLRIIRDRGNGTMTFLLDVKKEYDIIVEEAGSYNFERFKKDEG